MRLLDLVPHSTVLDIGTLVNRAHPLARGLLAWFLVLPQWSGGTRWINLVGMEHGTLTNMAMPATASSGWKRLTTRPGGWGELRFDGLDDQVQIPQTAAWAVSGGPLTIMAWLQDDAGPAGLGTFHRLLSWYDGSANIQCGLGLGNGGTDRSFFLVNGTGTVTPQVSSPLVALGLHHVAWTFDGTLYNLFVDGRSQTGGTCSAADTFTANTSTVYLGQRGDSMGWWSGFVDDVRVYRRCLSPLLVQAAYQQSRLRYPDMLRRLPMIGQSVLNAGQGFFRLMG